jgi:hypothetical protein
MMAREKEHRGQNGGANTGVRSQMKAGERRGSEQGFGWEAWPRENFNFEFSIVVTFANLGKSVRIFKLDVAVCLSSFVTAFVLGFDLPGMRISKALRE